MISAIARRLPSLAALAAGLALCVLGIAVPAMSGPSTTDDHFVPTVHTISCQWIIGRSHWGSNWFEGQFSKNTCSPSRVIRGFAHCEEGHNEDLRTGGWVHPAGKYSKKSCLAGYILKGGGVDVSGDGGSTWKRYWVTGNSPMRGPDAPRGPPAV